MEEEGLVENEHLPAVMGTLRLHPEDQGTPNTMGNTALRVNGSDEDVNEQEMVDTTSEVMQRNGGENSSSSSRRTSSRPLSTTSGSAMTRSPEELSLLQERWESNYKEAAIFLEVRSLSLHHVKRL